MKPRPELLFSLVLLACSSSADGPADEDECSDYLDVPGASPVELSVRNDRAEDVWLAQQVCTPSQFEISSGNTPQSLQLNDCSCEGAQEDRFNCAFTCDGPSDYLVRIPPGSTYTWTWSGEVLRRREMPQACYDDQDNSYDSCDQVIPAPEGAYSVAVTVHSGVSCSPGGGGECSCDAQPGEACEVQAFGFQSDATTPLAASFNVPSDSAVTLVAD